MINQWFQVFRRRDGQVLRRGGGDFGVERAVLVGAAAAPRNQALRRRQGRVPRRRRKRLQHSGMLLSMPTWEGGEGKFVQGMR